MTLAPYPNWTSDLKDLTFKHEDYMINIGKINLNVCSIVRQFWRNNMKITPLPPKTLFFPFSHYWQASPFCTPNSSFASFRSNDQPGQSLWSGGLHPIRGLFRFGLVAEHRGAAGGGWGCGLGCFFWLFGCFLGLLWDLDIPGSCSFEKTSQLMKNSWKGIESSWWECFTAAAWEKLQLSRMVRSYVGRP